MQIIKFLLVLFCLFSIHWTSQAQTDTTDIDITNTRKLVQETSYAYGYSYASDLTSNENFEAAERAAKYVVKGLKDGLTPDSAKLATIVEGLIARIDDPTLVTTGEQAQETAYNLGYNASGNLVSLLELEKSDLNYACIKKGYLDFVKGKTPEVDLDKQRVLLAKFLKEKQELAEARARTRRQQEGQANLAKATAFLKENAQKSMIKTTNSGLQYQVIKEGTGERPSVNGRVSVHYTGTFMNEKVFDSSIERGEPSEFNLNSVIKGWQEGIPLMREGARYRFFIPPALAYGENGRPTIPPNTLLIFDVELLKVIPIEA